MHFGRRFGTKLGGVLLSQKLRFRKLKVEAVFLVTAAAVLAAAAAAAGGLEVPEVTLLHSFSGPGLDVLAIQKGR